MAKKNVLPRTPEDFPCEKERSISIKCLYDNNQNHDKCGLAFNNYNYCIKFWGQISKSRKRNNVKPDLPPADERAEILREYKSTGKIPDYSKNSS